MTCRRRGCQEYVTGVDIGNGRIGEGRDVTALRIRAAR